MKEFTRLDRLNNKRGSVRKPNANLTVQPREKENNSQSLDTNIWGPLLWEMLFLLCFNCVDRQNVSDIQHLFQLLEYVMPCSHCRRSYAFYRRDLHPIAMVHNETCGTQCAKWLFTIHDMVNQKLGKICISFEKLQKKQKSLTATVTDFSLIDIFSMLWLSNYSNSVRMEKFCTFMNIVSRLLSHPNTPKHISIASYMRLENGLTSENMKDVLFSIKNHVLRKNGCPDQSMEDFFQQYEYAIAE